MLESNFSSAGLKCAGTLYLPEPAEVKPAVVILAHGFCAEKSFRLPAFAERFREAGFAAYLFDYRCFGDSEGEPRHWVSPARHLADWRAAIQHVRSLPDIDPDRVAIWGTSFAGGHVLKIASENPPIAAVISQVPHVNGMASLSAMKFKDIVSATVAGIRDVVGSTLFGRPYYSPVVGRPGSFAAMNTEDSWDGWYAIVPENSAWKNQVLSRVFLQMPLYSPGKSAARIKVPTLIVAAESDAVTPAVPAQKVANKIEKSECHILSNCGHFDPYVGQCFEKNIKFQLDFLKRHLG